MRFRVTRLRRAWVSRDNITPEDDSREDSSCQPRIRANENAGIQLQTRGACTLVVPKLKKCAVLLRFFKIPGAEGGTRTPTSCLTRPSNVRVCQFRHFGMK